MSKKGENIYKRRDGRWEARYIKFHTSEGQVQYGYCYGKTYHEAREKANRAKAGLMSVTQRKKVQKNNCVSTCCDEWLQLRRGRLKESTYVKYQTIMAMHPFGGAGHTRVPGADRPDFLVWSVWPEDIAAASRYGLLRL